GLEVARCADFVGGGSFGGVLSELAAGGAFVSFHGVAGGVDNEAAFGADDVDQVVDARSDLAAALGSAFAPVLVPHVADDDGGFAGFKGEGFFGDLIALARAGGEVKFFGECSSGGQ